MSPWLLEADVVSQGLVLRGAPPPWVIWLVIVPGLVGFAFLFYRMSRDVRPAMRFGLAALRTIVLLLVAFLLMDLDARGRPDLAATLLDGWLAARGDFEALAPLRLFQCYRALVRALTAGLRAQQRRDDSNAAAARARYLAAAERQVTTSRPKLIVVGGVSGAGKSWVAERLIGALGAVRVRSDVERKRIAGLGALGDSGGRIYSPELTRRTYARLGDAASKILEAGFPAIVDAACLMRAERDALRARARALGLSCRLVWVTAPVDVLAARITARRAAGRDPSEATVDVMRTQQHFVQPPGADELADGLILDTGAGIDLGVVTAALRR